MNYAELFIALVMGVSLSATCGFRIFVPLLITGLAVRITSIDVSPALSWTGSNLGLSLLAFATVVEVLTYYIPIVDNLMDTIAVPLAAVAGTLLTGGMLEGMPDALQWSLGVVAGGGAAAMVTTGTAAVRAVSSGASLGVGNHVVSTAENGLATAGSIIALCLPPIIAGILLILLIAGLCYLWRKLRKRRRTASAAPVPAR